LGGKIKARRKQSKAQGREGGKKEGRVRSGQTRKKKKIRRRHDVDIVVAVWSQERYNSDFQLVTGSCSIYRYGYRYGYGYEYSMI
jgi:hypothetical protein